MPLTAPKETVAYTGSCNPPRRAKRMRTDASPSTSSTAVASTNQQRSARPHILPRDPMAHRNSHHLDQESSSSEDEYDPASVAPAPKRRGRKPGTMSRSVRESQRKLNHSRIEKARRTKINETLSTLSGLVNEAETQKAAVHGGGNVAAQDRAEVNGKGSGKGKAEEKEFKLDVLVKAVSYMQELITRVKVLESRQCERCSSSSVTNTSHSAAPASSGKRKRDVDDIEADTEEVSIVGDGDDVYVGDDEKGDDMEDDIEEISPPTLPSRVSSVHPSPRLPPIASWLPHPYVDPSCIAALSDTNPPTSTSYLPSPPLSGRFRPAMSTNMQSLPTLTLPGPARPLISENAGAAVHIDTQPKLNSITMPIRRSSNATVSTISTTRGVSRSPAVSPTWTPEDESAASLLLQMSSSPSSSGSSSSSMGMSNLKLPMTGERSLHGVHERSSSLLAMQVQTPSSLLGM